MFSSDNTISSRDMSWISGGFNLSNANSFRKVSSAHGTKSTGSDFSPIQIEQPGRGLSRYKSAPSSFLPALLESNNNDNSGSGDEAEAFFSSLISGPTPGDLNRTDGSNDDDDSYQMQYRVIKKEDSEARTGQDSGLVNGQLGYEGAVNNSSRLVRQRSSPDGFFSGFGVIGGEVGNYRVQNQEQAISSANNGITYHMNFSSAPSASTTRFMPSIPENVNENIGTRNPENGQLRNGDDANVGGGGLDVVFPHDSWNDSPFGDSLKRNRDGEMKMRRDNLSTREGRRSSTGLVHHLSLPRSSKVEKFMHFQPEAVHCQVRAKRGFATHPRSIAERVRRTRISEKMKKLQDLFPNMDKQTSTADMLDLSVEYIKDLQQQVEMLNETKAKCVCTRPQQS